MKSKLNNMKTLLYRLGKDPDKKKKSYRKKQNRNLGQNGTALEAIEKVGNSSVSLFFCLSCTSQFLLDNELHT